MATREKSFIRENGLLFLVALCVGILGLSIARTVSAPSKPLNSTSQTDAQTACDTSFVSFSNPIGAPAGTIINKSCIGNNVQMYSGDARYLFFFPLPELQNATFIQTPNALIKDLTFFSWDVTTTVPAKLYIMTRHIPGIRQAPAWITNGGYTRKTNDDLSNIQQYTKRKNDQGLIGLYDIYTKDVPAGRVTLGAASDSSTNAYSMYLVALVKQSSPTPTPDALVERAKALNASTPGACFVVYNDAKDGRHIYNISDYFKFHTGGIPSIQSACGTDMTQRYNNGDPAYPEASAKIPHVHTNASNDILRIFMVE